MNIAESRVKAPKGTKTVAGIAARGGVFSRHTFGDNALDFSGLRENNRRQRLSTSPTIPGATQRRDVCSVVRALDGQTESQNTPPPRLAD